MIRPALQDDALLADIQATGQNPETLHVWWLGQSGFLTRWRDTFVLFDPYLSDSLTRKYAATDKPHVRMTERVIAPDRLDFINVVTSSHNHTDHLDAETLLPLINANPGLQIVVPAANRAFAANRLSLPEDRLLPVDPAAPVTAAGVRLHAIPAAHNDLETDGQGRHKFIGLVAELGPWRVYHSGDTLLYDGMPDRLRALQPDIAFVPINGNVPARRVAGNLDGREAARLAKDIGAKIAIPHHFEMFEFNTVSPDLFITSCEELGQPFKVLRNGERWSSSAIR
jgi:L-ascorbate metabolism protein UlaG (beta-lactamase superfamily)